MKPLLIAGPTASGKTALSLLLAERLNAEIVSADSRQVYRFMNIGTAKPSPKELQHVPHHFIDILNPDQDYNAAEYGKSARSAIVDITARGKSAIIVGGSGLYMRSLIDGFFDGPGRDPEIRERLETIFNEKGIDPLMVMLRDKDSKTAATIDASKPRRVIRALEVCLITGTPLSDHIASQSRIPLLNVIQIGLWWKREQLYDRINDRVDQMIRLGLIEETEGLLQKGYSSNLNSLNTVGYKEIISYLNKNMTLSEAVDFIKMNSRRFAKRQITWFRAEKRIAWFDVDQNTDPEQLAERIVREATLKE
jgi:tRNA dimethylallyltransferase